MKKMMVPKAGLEPARVSPLPPQDSVSTKFHHFGTNTVIIEFYSQGLPVSCRHPYRIEQALFPLWALPLST